MEDGGAIGNRNLFIVRSCPIRGAGIEVLVCYHYDSKRENENYILLKWLIWDVKALRENFWFTSIFSDF